MTLNLLGLNKHIYGDVVAIKYRVHFCRCPPFGANMVRWANLFVFWRQIYDLLANT